MRDGDSSSGSEDVEDMDEDEAEDDLAGEASVDDDLQGSDDDFFPAALARKHKGAPGGGTGSSSSSGGGGSNGGAAALGPAKRARPDPAAAPLEVPRCPRHARAVGGLRAVPSGRRLRPPSAMPSGKLPLSAEPSGKLRQAARDV
jgi:hypothetical protein